MGRTQPGGFGLTPQIAEEFFDLGIDVITTGNHVWDKRELVDYFNSAANEPYSPARRVLRPANYPAGTPGVGVYEGTTRGGVPYAVVNLQGRVFMANIDDPFRVADRLLETISAKVIFVDFHAEATSEKVALGWYLDGRVTAVVGTHTHIPTADTRVLPRRHGVPDRRWDDRALRQRDRGAEGADPATLFDQSSGAIRGGGERRALLRGAGGLRREHRQGAQHPTNHAGRGRARGRRKKLAESTMEEQREDESHGDAADGTGNADCRDGFDWRAFDAYLFDIDGTLLNSQDGVHYEAFLIAMRELYGRTVALEGVPVQGSTDPMILLRRWSRREFARRTDARHWTRRWRGCARRSRHGRMSCVRSFAERCRSCWRS